MKERDLDSSSAYHREKYFKTKKPKPPTAALKTKRSKRPIFLEKSGGKVSSSTYASLRWRFLDGRGEENLQWREQHGPSYDRYAKYGSVADRSNALPEATVHQMLQFQAEERKRKEMEDLEGEIGSKFKPDEADKEYLDVEETDEVDQFMRRANEIASVINQELKNKPEKNATEEDGHWNEVEASGSSSKVEGSEMNVTTTSMPQEDKREEDAETPEVEKFREIVKESSQISDYSQGSGHERSLPRIQKGRRISVKLPEKESEQSIELPDIERNPQRVRQMPTFMSRHPVRQVREVFDFPDELMSEKMKKQLSDEMGSVAAAKLIEELTQKRARQPIPKQFNPYKAPPRKKPYGLWYVPPKHWNKWYKGRIVSEDEEYEMPTRRGSMEVSASFSSDKELDVSRLYISRVFRQFLEETNTSVPKFLGDSDGVYNELGRGRDEEMTLLGAIERSK